MHRKCTSAGRVTSQCLLSFLVLTTPITAVGDDRLHPQQQPLPLLPDLPFPPKSEVPAGDYDHVFKLRHVFNHKNINRPAEHIRIDIPKTESPVWIESEEGGILVQETRPLVVKSSSMNIHRLKDRRPSVVDPMVAAAREYSDVWAMGPEAWTLDDVYGPDVTDKETILSLAQMAANAYCPIPGSGNWKDVEGGFNRTNDEGFGWQGNTLQGYLYADESNSTIVISIKGTSLAIWDGQDTTTNDKENDNLYFSCCCGQQGSAFYRTVCDCATATYTCNLTCLKKSLKKENRYYAMARQLYSNVTAMYPDSDIWLTGHSLGGAISSLVGLTYGIPAITFEAVPDALPANRLGLPVPPGVDPDRPGQRDWTGAFHFGQNADPIYLGTCNGATASCSFAGYALESSCHSGRECVYDVVKNNGTGVSIYTHKIIYVIENVIKKYTEVPECKFTPECYDCPLWKEVTGNSSQTTSSTTSSTRTQTRTETCKTPGWWGCLDETTTTSATTTSSSTTTTSTSTCKTPGWFGCNDEKTTTTSASKTSLPTATSTPTTTCATPGWWGCNDPTTTSQGAASPTSSICHSPGLFWGCYDQSTVTVTTTTTTTLSHAITSPPPVPTSTRIRATASPSPSTTQSACTPYFFGLICLGASPTPIPDSKEGKRMKVEI
ncbi:hypothetical protein HYFRA_00005590 [Hymenoscyphus fraxineus]|uniref:triacylglycerol lipase n=1 Tax=Hymenoscyphus fraxineus TaxID=746836 RepID=A0A9N9PM08_9HELO|nr:hypothetical protein HYFRA_00005590 [Hymenoscyphus fraxineus]